MNLLKIGAGWLKDSKNGNKYISGNMKINGKSYQVMIFKNTKKTKDTQPDFSINITTDEIAPAVEQPATDDDGLPF